MTRADATHQFWRFSQHYTALPDEEKEAFLMFTVAPTIAASTCQIQRTLLGRLMSRCQLAVTTG